MEQSLNELLSLSFICLCLAIAAITEILRRIGEFILDKPQVPASKTSKIWTDLLLPIAPFANGIIFTMLIKSYPYPDGWHSGGSRFILGLVAVSLSGLVYRVAKSFLKDKIENYKKSRSTPPPPLPPASSTE
jgi:hypothetical protein